MNRRAAVQRQLGLKRMLDRRPALAVQARLATDLSGRPIQRAAMAPGRDAHTAVARAERAPDSSRRDELVPAGEQAMAGSVMQLIYLWDRAQGEKKPQWSDKTQPPEDFLISGSYDDNEHGKDKLYARLGGTDLFYGIAYSDEDDPRMQKFIEKVQTYAEENQLPMETPEEQNEAFRTYLLKAENPVLDVEGMKLLFGGSSGWDQYQPFLPEKSQRGKAEAIRDLNKNLPWAKDNAGFACQIAMVDALTKGGSVRFVLDGLQNIRGILEGTAFKEKVTTYELQMVMALLDKTIALPKEETVRPVDGENVFFYLNRQLVPAEKVATVG
jgi:hypothetical protein